jgi:hypothetical protein
MWQGKIENKKYKRRVRVRNMGEGDSGGVPLTLGLMHGRFSQISFGLS